MNRTLTGQLFAPQHILLQKIDLLLDLTSARLRKQL